MSTLRSFNETQRHFFTFANLAFPTDGMRHGWNVRVQGIQSLLEQQFGRPIDLVYGEVDRDTRLCEEAAKKHSELVEFLAAHKVPPFAL